MSGEILPWQRTTGPSMTTKATGLPWRLCPQVGSITSSTETTTISGGVGCSGAMGTGTVESISGNRSGATNGGGHPWNNQSPSPGSAFGHRCPGQLAKSARIAVRPGFRQTERCLKVLAKRKRRRSRATPQTACTEPSGKATGPVGFPALRHSAHPQALEVPGDERYPTPTLPQVLLHASQRPSENSPTYSP